MRAFLLFCCVFEGCFGKSGCFIVVFRWCDLGAMCGERGVLTVRFSSLKNTPRFRTIFLLVPVDVDEHPLEQKQIQESFLFSYAQGQHDGRVAGG
jgi:hypothetical protein